VNREFHPQEITSPLGDTIHFWGTTSPLGVKNCPRGEAKNWPQKPNQRSRVVKIYNMTNNVNIEIIFPTAKNVLAYYKAGVVVVGLDSGF
jgi:hypothetical protein